MAKILSDKQTWALGIYLQTFHSFCGCFAKRA